MLKKNGGITLIALVITIIVLLILAGVSIAMLTGDNGLLNRSTQAADKEVLAGGKDAITTDVAAFMADYYEDKYVNDVDVGTEVKYVSDKLVGNTTDNPKKTGKYAVKTAVQGCVVSAITECNTTGATIKIIKSGAKADDTAAIGTVQSDGTISWSWSTVTADDVTAVN